MSEPGRFSLEKLVSELPFGKMTLLAALLAGIASLFLSREHLAEIPEWFETSFSYDAQLRSTIKTRGLSADNAGVTFVDVDNNALGQWSNATRTTPRDKIQKLLEKAVALKPAVLFVDFDLAGSSDGEGDSALKAWLDAYPPTAPPLLLTREMPAPVCEHGKCPEDPCEGHDGKGHQTQATAEADSAVRSLPFETVTAGKPNILWVSSLFIPDGDGVVRRWRLWDAVCRNGTAQIWPSAQLAAAAFSKVGVSEGRARLEAYLAAIKAAHGTPARPAVAWPQNLKAQEAYVPFLIGGAARARVSDWRAGSGFQYQRVRATSLFDDQVAESALAGRAVVIGASYGPDKFATPFGVMPGAALVANAIAAAPAVLDHGPASKVTVLFFTLVLFLIYAVIAKLFRAMPAAVIILAISYVWLSLISLVLNAADAVQTTSMALVVFGVFLTVEALLELGEAVYEGHGLRALLRKPAHGKEHSEPADQIEKAEHS